FAKTKSLDFLARTETWITPDNTATPAALSAGYSFSHTPRASGQGRGTGLLISLSWKFCVLPSPNLIPSFFEVHAITVTHPSKLHIIVLYRPPGPLGCFLDELGTLLSSLPEDGTPAILLGDFNLPPETSQLSRVASLLQSFALSQSFSPPTHKAGNQLDLVFTRSCSIPQLTVTPLHLSDHFFLSFFLSPYLLLHNSFNSSPTITFRRNLSSLSQSSLLSTALSTLPPPASFSNLPVDLATSTFNSCLSQSFDSLCPLVSKPACSSPPAHD
ncbi:hypothetical protein ANANG_G00194020, partial [Anguilla anguilla]